jgi:LPXTG-motif cell wall-anchored protein
MSPDPTGEMYAWITMAAVSAIMSAVGIFAAWKRRR